MPYAVWLPWASYFVGGVAFHESPEVPSTAASHGCVRVPHGDAEWLYRRIPRRDAGHGAEELALVATQLWQSEGVKPSPTTMPFTSCSRCTLAGSFASQSPGSGVSMLTAGVTPGPSVVKRYFEPLPCRGGESG